MYLLPQSCSSAHTAMFTAATRLQAHVPSRLSLPVRYPRHQYAPVKSAFIVTLERIPLTVFLQLRTLLLVRFRRWKCCLRVIVCSLAAHLSGMRSWRSDGELSREQQWCVSAHDADNAVSYVRKVIGADSWTRDLSTGLVEGHARVVRRRRIR